MAKWRNDNDYTMVIPTISVVAEPGDVFDGPDDLKVAGVVVAEKGFKKPEPVAPVDAAETESGE